MLAPSLRRSACGQRPGRRASDLEHPVLRAVVPPLPVLREDPRRRLQRVRHLQPHVPAGLLRRPDRGVLGAAQRRDRVGRLGRADRRDHRAGRVGLHQHAHLPRPDEVRRRAGQVRARSPPRTAASSTTRSSCGSRRTAGGWPSPTPTPACGRAAWRPTPGMDVKVREPEVYPVQVQGPKSKDVMRTLFGDAILDIKYYWTLTTELDGIPVVISRTGWTGEVGYEIYLRDPVARRRPVGPDHGGGQAARDPPDRPVRGAPDRGRHLQLRLGHDHRQQPVRGHGPRAPRRAAGGRLHRQGGPRGDPRERRQPQARRHRGRRRRAPVRARRASATRSTRGEPVGTVTDLIWSPRLEKNIGYVWVPIELAGARQRRSRSSRPTAGIWPATTAAIPFLDPKKTCPADLTASTGPLARSSPHRRSDP